MKPVLSALNVLTLIICAQLLSGCSDQGGSKQKAADQVQDIGTGDGGGGNAINFKMLESHIFDPNTLPAVKNQLAAAIKALSPSESSSFNIFGMKTWYLAPMTLKTLPKDVLGIEFTADRIQQIAIQTQREVWIDANYFNKMSEEEQARLILHELMMASYMFRFKDAKENCESINRMGATCDINDLESYELANDYEPPRRLNEKDYNIIRTMTEWFFQNRAQMSDKVFQQEANRIGFSGARSDESEEKVKIKYNGQTILSALKKAHYGKTLNGDCNFLKQAKVIPCLVELHVQEGDHMAPVTVIVKDKESGEIFRQDTFKLSVAYSAEYDATSSHRVTISEQSSGLSKAQPGTLGNDLELVFKYDPRAQELELVGFAMQAVVYAGGEVDKSNEKQDCVKEIITPLNGETLLEDILIVGNPIKAKNGLKYWSNRLNRGGGTTCYSKAK